MKPELANVKVIQVTNPKARPSIEIRTSRDTSRATGRSVKYHRVIDRDGNRYQERLVDSKTGRVLRDCTEPLADHTGRGSAKSPTPGASRED
jgi:hypothetical protein